MANLVHEQACSVFYFTEENQEVVQVQGEACSLSPKGSATAVTLGPLVRLPTSSHLADTTSLSLQR